MFTKLIIATANQGKYREFSEMIFDHSDGKLAEEIVFSPDIAGLAVEETGRSYAENSMLKARAWAERSGLPCLADDSGLEVNHLKGAPGLFSARTVQGSDTDKASWLLTQLEGVTDRRARFTASLCLCVPNEYTLITEGYCYGNISTEQKGFGGFGYDPVFIPDGYELTFAELPQSIKNSISHRANALRKLKALLCR